jgi:hypothetical protein
MLQVLRKIQKHDPSLPAMCFISLSKSVSRGITTGGALVANDTKEATELMHQVNFMIQTRASTELRGINARLCGLCTLLYF